MPISSYDCYPTKVGVQLPAVTRGKLWRQELLRNGRGIYSNAMQSGRMADSFLKVHPLLETQRKTQPPSTRPKAVSRVPSPIPSSDPWEPKAIAEWSCRPQAHSLDLHVGLAPPLAMWLPGPEGPANTDQFVHKVGKRSVLSFSWIYICFPIQAKPDTFSTQNSACSWRIHYPQPIFSHLPSLPLSPN